MGVNLITKILNKSISVKYNQYIILNVDFLMGHDGTASLIIDKYRSQPFSFWDIRRILIVFDHFAPPATIERANIQKKLKEFVIEYDIPYALFDGICHQLLLEHSGIGPGDIVVGADSHTCTAGCFGAFAIGLGSTDFFYILKSGKIWMRIPEVIKIELYGTINPIIMGKDIALYLFTLFQPNELQNFAVEFIDHTDSGISMDSRATICNMMTDLGAITGLFVPDETTRTYCLEWLKKFDPISPDTDAFYDREIKVNVSDIEPMVALPDNPFNVKPISKLNETIPVDQIFIGSCTSGRKEDVLALDQIIQKYALKKELKKIFIPASNSILKRMIQEKSYERMIQQGVVIGNPSCGPCCNIDKGLLADNERCLSTSNRNFKGRMGSDTSSVYLVSSLTAAQSMVTGILTASGDDL